MALPGWCPGAGGRMLTWMGCGQERDGCDICGHTVLNHAGSIHLCQCEWDRYSASSSPPRLERMYINRSIRDLMCSYSVLTHVPREEKCLFQVVQIISLLSCVVHVL